MNKRGEEGDIDREREGDTAGSQCDLCIRYQFEILSALICHTLLTCMCACLHVCMCECVYVLALFASLFSTPFNHVKGLQKKVY